VKARALTVNLLAFGVLIPPLSFAEKAESSQSVAKYDISKETKLQGVIEEVKDRLCPMSGGMGLRLTVKIQDKIYEVHVAPVKFVKLYKASYQKGDTVEIIGVSTKFQGGNAILPREIKDDGYDLVFRDENGMPIW